jgi:hypothetical protein
MPQAVGGLTHKTTGPAKGTGTGTATGNGNVNVNAVHVAAGRLAVAAGRLAVAAGKLAAAAAQQQQMVLQLGVMGMMGV